MRIRRTPERLFRVIERRDRQKKAHKLFDYLCQKYYYFYANFRHSEILVRTTLDLDPDLIENVRRTTGLKIKKRAIETALREYLKARKCDELAALVGNYDKFELTPEKLDEMRREP